jgi:site-specific DNA recombinase
LSITPDFFINESIEIACNLQYYSESSDFETKLRLQKTVFPDGLFINPLNRRYLTRNVNRFFIITRRFSRALNWAKNEKAVVKDGFFPPVAGTGLEPLTFGL